jgi:hypothetical protein
MGVNKVPDLKLGETKASMIVGVKNVIKDGWPQVKNFAEVEMKLLAQSIIEINSLAVSKKISKAEARSLMRQHKNATTAVLAGIEGMSILLAEQAVNAALSAIRDAVNTAAGFKIV